jgi:hypothetical protein
VLRAEAAKALEAKPKAEEAAADEEPAEGQGGGAEGPGVSEVRPLTDRAVMMGSQSHC